MTTRALYVADVTLVLGWAMFRTVAGPLGPSFPWLGIPLLLGLILLAKYSVSKRSYEKYRRKWPPVVGTGLLASYFVFAAIMTVRGYVRGTVIASVAQLGFVLGLIVFVVVCFAAALWDLSHAG
jgi:hypothetical protein